MTDNYVYDVTISEAAKILDKSDRQVRRYVKEGRLKAETVRVDGHTKLMFNRDELIKLRDSMPAPVTMVPTPESDLISDSPIDEAETISNTINQQDSEETPEDTGNTETVKYVIDVLKNQIEALRQENKELHFQLERHSGLIGFWQGKAETLQEELKALAPVPRPDDEKEQRSWWKWFWGIK